MQWTRLDGSQEHQMKREREWNNCCGKNMRLREELICTLIPKPTNLNVISLNWADLDFNVFIEVGLNRPRRKWFAEFDGIFYMKLCFLFLDWYIAWFFATFVGICFLSATNEDNDGTNWKHAPFPRWFRVIVHSDVVGRGRCMKI